MVTQVPDRLEPPPRLPGISPEADIGAMREWMWQLYENLILNKGVIQVVDQPQSTYDPATGAIAPFPVGYVLHTTRADDPATYLGYGTWERIAQGRVLIGIDETDADFDEVRKESGAKTHTLTVGEMPSHTHVQDSHNHTQDAHTHLQNAHNHTQDAHNHTQDAHAHGQSVVNSANDGTTGVRGSSDANTSTDGDTASVVATNQATVATNQATTAVNQNTTATNQATVATNQNTGGGAAHSILQPGYALYIWERTA